MSRSSGYGSSSRNTRSSARIVLFLLILGLFLVIGVCCASWAVISRFVDGGQETTTPDLSSSGLVVAYSPEKDVAFRTLVDGFNRQRFQSPDGETMSIAVVAMSPEAMIEAVLQGNTSFQALAPDSSIWLGQLDEEWQAATASEGLAVGETVRFAVSPVVIAMWEETAREMGWPDGAVSWQDLLRRAQADPSFRWSHPSTSSASGLLATLAEFYAAVGKSRGLTIEDVQAQETLDYVAALERTVRYYGEGDEPALIERALAEGRDFLDAFVVQEQMVVTFNTQRREQPRLVAVYPREGTLWEDHPLALLEVVSPTPLQRQIFSRFRDYLLSPEAQQLVLSHGYRPADLSTPLDGPESPLTLENGVDPSQPATTLQVPSAQVVAVVRDVWWYTKRHTNVYLVVDTSGSMRGEKLEQAKMALQAFLQQIQGDMERVGLVRFSTYVDVPVYLDELGKNRAALESAVAGLRAEGDTALLDGVYEAYRRLQELGDAERINAIVVMTDGQENRSSISLRRLVRELENQGPVPMVVFCIAYGRDADLVTLRAIAEPTGGQVREGDLETIQDLYQILSTYF
jgi:Ca-activated chloride channel homolog